MRKDLNDLSAAITNIKSKVYDGNPYMPAVKVTVIEGNKKVTLTQGADYRVLYENNINAGSGKVIVRGNGIYKGEIAKEFKITKKQFKKLKVVTGGAAANQTSILPVYVYDGSKLLKEGIDYELSSLTDIRTTSAKVTVSAAENSNYEGAVKAGKKKLKANKDYSIVYMNNLHKGTATVRIEGKGNYAGIQSEVTFTNNSQKISKASVKGTRAKGITLTYNKKVLGEGIDYTLEYGEKKNGKVQVIITGTGDFTGEMKKFVKDDTAPSD